MLKIRVLFKNIGLSLIILNHLTLFSSILAFPTKFLIILFNDNCIFITMRLPIKIFNV